MEKVFNDSFISLVLVLSFSIVLNAYSFDQKTYKSKADVSHQITVNYEFGTDLNPTGYTNIYVVWLENTDANFIQNIAVCEKLITNATTGTALPFWKINKYPKSSSSEIDAVTAATKKNCNFSISTILKDNSIRKFKVYFEIDRSFEPNDWFADQPAVLYSADINLDDTTKTYSLQPIGWTPNENTENIIPNTSKGVLQREMRYITNFKNNETFGNKDPRSLTSIVKNITATVQNIPTIRANTIPANNNNISLNLKQTSGQIYLTSKDVITEIFITDSQGKVFFQAQPKSKNAFIKINPTTIPNGLYIIKLLTAKGIISRKLLLKN